MVGVGLVDSSWVCVGEGYSRSDATSARLWPLCPLYRLHLLTSMRIAETAPTIEAAPDRPKSADEVSGLRYFSFVLVELETYFDSLISNQASRLPIALPQRNA